jgi:ABC-type branched-subunit amino acid transport system ATPase component
MSKGKVRVQVEGLSKSFGGIKAISNLSFELYQSEVLGVIGPNGSGKTTLLNLITGFLKKDSGKVFFEGKDMSKWPAHKIANSGIVRTFQVVRPYTTLPAFKNIIPPLHSPRSRRATGGKLGDMDTVAIDILEEVGFERDARVPYKLAGTLPLGYLKRLELARCLAMKPKVIITDELFSGLSMAEIASLLPLIRRLHEERGISLIMIEHRIRELFQVANRVIVMNFGEKIAYGLPEDVMKEEKVRKAYVGESLEV